MATAVIVDELELVFRSDAATYTVADWEKMPDDGRRYEIINGVIWVSTAPILFHEWITQEIIATMRVQLVDTGVAFVFSAPVGVFMPNCDPVEPDLIVIRQNDLDLLKDHRVYGVPALLVEILSRGSVRYDSETKREAYARAGVPEYWIVRPQERDVLVHSAPDTVTGQYAQVTHALPDGELVSPTLPFRARIADFFVGARYTKS